MTGSKNGKCAADSETFVVNAGYLRAQALEAAASFFAPLSGVWGAIAGQKASNGREFRRSK